MRPADQFARDGQSRPVCPYPLSGLQVVLVIRGALPVGSLRRLVSRPSQGTGEPCRLSLPAALFSSELWTVTSSPAKRTAFFELENLPVSPSSENSATLVSSPTP